MGRMSLFSRTADLPGMHGVLRDCTPMGKGFKRFKEGDIAVIDAPDISRRFAQRLIEMRPQAVVNIARFTTGTVPNFGPQLLIDAGIPLYENTGAQLQEGFRDGKKGRITEDGGIFLGENQIGSSTPLDSAGAQAAFRDAQQILVDNMEAYFGNTTQFIHSEAPLLIDGIGIPDTGVAIEGRKVVVLSPDAGHKETLKNLRNFIREYDPVLIGVNEAADSLVQAGYTPALVVGDPQSMAAETLRSGARVILPAEPDGHAPGLERIQDLGVGAMTFPAATHSATDLAMLLANYHGAQLIVNAGSPRDLNSLFAQGAQASPAALLTRAKVGPKLVDASAISNLYTVQRGGGLGWLWAILGILVALAVIIVVVGTAGQGTFTDNLIDTWNNIALTVQAWFHR